MGHISKLPRASENVPALLTGCGRHRPVDMTQKPDEHACVAAIRGRSTFGAAWGARLNRVRRRARIPGQRSRASAPGPAQARDPGSGVRACSNSWLHRLSQQPPPPQPPADSGGGGRGCVRTRG